MAFVEWTDDMSVGVDRLDQDHRTLIGLLNELHAVLSDDGTEGAVGHALGELIRYTYYHFGAEERLLEEAGYADLEAHRQSHRAMAERVRRMESDFHADPRAVVADELAAFLSDWLVHHIRSEDMRYAPALRPR